MGKQGYKSGEEKRAFSSYISISLRCTHCSPTIQMPGISFYGGGGEGGGVSLLENFRLNLLVHKRGVSIDRETEC